MPKNETLEQLMAELSETQDQHQIFEIMQDIRTLFGRDTG
jgi:hypothetical protein